MLKAELYKYILRFNVPGNTSRGSLLEKPTYFVKLFRYENPDIFGIGECPILPGLSVDDSPDFYSALEGICQEIIDGKDIADSIPDNFPSVRFGFETAFLDLENGGKKILYPSLFTQGLDSIAINGLIWMGSLDRMIKEIENKISEGFLCLKLKIGSLRFEDELELIAYIRKKYSHLDLDIRVDANGAFSYDEVFHKLELLSNFSIHSVEQPIKPGKPELMAEICKNSSIPVALDEELIGIFEREKKKELLEFICPAYIILKPSLLGGFAQSAAWIDLAEQNGILWWITSALESNIGLNAIAQWTYSLKNPLPQGLGTGKVFSNNIEGPLFVEKGFLKYHPEKSWNKFIFDESL